MLKLIDRFIIRQIGITFLAVGIALLLLFLSNLLVRHLGDAASGSMPASVVLTLLGFEAIKYGIILVPLSLHLGIVLSLGRMYSDSEMTALASCGVGSIRLFKPVLMVAIPLAACLAVLAFQTVPWANRMMVDLVDRAQQKLDFDSIEPGRFHESAGRGRLIYIERLSKDHSRMENVFIHLLRKGTPVLLSARSGSWKVDPKTGATYLVLHDGHRYDGLPGSADFRILNFATYGVLIRSEPISRTETRAGAKRTSTLIRSGTPAAMAELQWRLAIPLATIVLALLAVPLARLRPRQGRFIKVPIAAFVYMIYVNFLSMAQQWTGEGTISPGLGLWWVHGITLLAVAALVLKEYGLGYSTMWLRRRL